MTSTIKRLVGALSAVAFAAVAGLVVAPAAHADGDYYGTWTMVSFTNGTGKIKCDGPNKGPDKTGCLAGQKLTLTPDYRFTMSKYIFLTLLVGRKGSFVAPVFPSTGERVLVFVSDAGRVQPLGSAFDMALKQRRDGSPTKMVLSMETGLGMVEVVFRRDVK